MTVVERWLAAIVLVACVALLVRLALPWKQRQRLDSWLRGLRMGRSGRRGAEREALSAIERARRSALRDVKREQQPKPPRRLH
jgi:putative exporter of polyketide antibiotics